MNEREFIDEVIEDLSYYDFKWEEALKDELIKLLTMKYEAMRQCLT